MSGAERFPVFDGNIEKYLEQMGCITKVRQRQLLGEARDACDLIIRSYWYTWAISGITTFSSDQHHQIDTNPSRDFGRWYGIWCRMQETLNILYDSVVLGLEGRTTSSTNLLRAAMESIVTGVFYHHLSLPEYRASALVVNDLRIGRNSDVFHNLVTEAIASIENEKDIPLQLEYQVSRIAYAANPPLHVPSFKAMLKQIAEWKVLENDTKEIIDNLYDKWFDHLSTYAHSLIDSSYISGAAKSGNMEILLGWDVDVDSFRNFANEFNSMCIIVLHLFLASTVELQTTREFSNRISYFLEKNPQVDSILKSIIMQIRELIKNIP